MARGDPRYAKYDVDIWRKEKIRALSNGAFRVYMYLWSTAVECRSSVLPPDLASVSSVAGGIGKRWNSVDKWLAEIHGPEVCIKTLMDPQKYASLYAKCTKWFNESVDVDNSGFNESVNESVDGSVEWVFNGIVERHSTKALRGFLATRFCDGSLYVHNVKEMHDNLRWDKQYYPIPHLGNDPCPKRGKSFDPRLRVREEEEGNSVPLGTSIFNTGCSAFSNSEPEKIKTAVDRKSDLGNENREGELGAQDSGIPTDPKKIAALTWEVQASLNLDDSSEAIITRLVSSHPTVEVYKAIAAVRDKQHRILTGPDERFSKGPLEYFKGILNKSKSQKGPK